MSYVGPSLPDDAFIESAEPLNRDVLCRHCGYNLRGHRPSQRCSECGMPIRDSLFPDQLQFADPDWLDKLRLGMTLILWSIVIGFLFGLVGSFLMATGFSPALVILATLLSAGLQTCGVFMLTTQEPRVALTEDPVTLRSTIRICAIVMLAGGAFQSVIPIGLAFPAVMVAGLVHMVASLIVLFGQFVFLRRFARRIPDDILARSTTIVMWGGVSVFALVLIFAVLPVATTLAAPGGGGVAVGFVCMFLTFLMAMGVWYLILLLRYRRAFAAAAEFARENAMPEISARPQRPSEMRPLG